MEFERKAIMKVMEAGEVPMMVGNQGVGKTQMIRDIGKDTGREVITLITSQMEPGDLIGLPWAQDGKTVWLQPNWWPEGEDYIIFLDEIARARASTRNAIMQLLIDKKLHEHVLPEGVWLVAAMNPNDERFEQEEIFDDAFIDRFVWFSVRNDVDEWKKWARNRVDNNILGFLDNEAQYFGDSEDVELPEIKPSPRSWEKLSNILSTLSDEEKIQIGTKIARGLVGNEAALSLQAYLVELNKRIKPEEIWKNTEDVVKKVKGMEIHQVNELVEKTLRYISKKKPEEIELEPLVDVLAAAPAESSAKFCRDLKEMEGDYKDEFIKNERFSNLYIRTKFPSDMKFKRFDPETQEIVDVDVEV
jgi:MoxR-like ATPase